MIWRRFWRRWILQPVFHYPSNFQVLKRSGFPPTKQCEVHGPLHGPQVDGPSWTLPSHACFRFTYTSLAHIKPSIRSVLRGTRVELGVSSIQLGVSSDDSDIDSMLSWWQWAEDDEWAGDGCCCYRCCCCRCRAAPARQKCPGRGLNPRHLRDWSLNPAP